jgi:hypothetical protein
MVHETGSKGLSNLPNVWLEFPGWEDYQCHHSDRVGWLVTLNVTSLLTQSWQKEVNLKAEQADRWQVYGNLPACLKRDFLNVSWYLIPSISHAVLISLVIWFPGALSIRNSTLEEARAFSRNVH